MITLDIHGYKLQDQGEPNVCKVFLSGKKLDWKCPQLRMTLKIKQFYS